MHLFALVAFSLFSSSQNKHWLIETEDKVIPKTDLHTEHGSDYTEHGSDYGPVGGPDPTVKPYRHKGGYGYDDEPYKCTYNCLPGGYCVIKWTKGYEAGSATCIQKEKGGTCPEEVPKECGSCHEKVETPCKEPLTKYTATKKYTTCEKEPVKCTYTCVKGGQCRVDWTKGYSSASAHCLSKKNGGKCPAGVPKECSDCHGKVDKPCKGEEDKTITCVVENVKKNVSEKAECNYSCKPGGFCQVDWTKGLESGSATCLPTKYGGKCAYITPEECKNCHDEVEEECDDVKKVESNSGNCSSSVTSIKVNTTVVTTVEKAVKCGYSCGEGGQCVVKWTKGYASGTATCFSKEFGGKCPSLIPKECSDCHGNVDKPCKKKAVVEEKAKCKYSCMGGGYCKVMWTKSSTSGSSHRTQGGMATCVPVQYGGKCPAGVPKECSDCHGNVDKPCGSGKLCQVCTAKPSQEKYKCSYKCIKDGYCKVQWTKGFSGGSSTCVPLKYGGKCHHITPKECNDCHGNVAKKCEEEEKEIKKTKCSFKCGSGGSCNVKWTGYYSGSSSCLAKSYGGYCAEGTPEACSACHENTRCG